MAPIWMYLDLLFDNIECPMVLCRFIISHSAGSNFPGLSSTLSGMPILPMSCIGAAYSKSWHSSSVKQPNSSAIIREYLAIRSTWLPVPSSRYSPALARRMMVSRSLSTICCVVISTWRASQLARSWIIKCCWCSWSKFLQLVRHSIWSMGLVKKAVAPASSAS